MIIRSVFRGPAALPAGRAGSRGRSAQLLQSIDALLREYEAGRVRGYDDLVLAGSTIPR